MYHPTTVIFIILLQVTLVINLDCFTGRFGFGMTYTKCDPNVKYCIKVANADIEFDQVIDKGCDTENFCHTIGPHCSYNGFTDMQICCCKSNLCNGSVSYFHYWKLSSIVILIIVALNLSA